MNMPRNGQKAAWQLSDEPYPDLAPTGGAEAAPIAGRELDALIERNVMGIVWDESRCRVCGWPLVSEGGCSPDNCSMRPLPKWRVDEPAPYSTDIRDAWLVVEKMRNLPPRFANLCMTAYCYNRTYATFDALAFRYYSPETWAEANGEHATPLAICLASLKAIDALAAAAADTR